MDPELTSAADAVDDEDLAMDDDMDSEDDYDLGADLIPPERVG